MKKPIILNIEPIGKPRMVKSDAWAGRECVKRYWQYKDDLNILAKSQRYTPINTLDVKFYLSMPKSWSEKKKESMNGKYHTSKPDIDNLIKAFLDCLIDDDSGIYKITASKYWATKGRIEI